jgi:hypothetical protein
MTSRKRLSYEEGQWFGVPLRGGGYAVGIIVRGSVRTRGGLGYFFGPSRASVPTSTDIEGLAAADAIYVTWFGDLGLINGRWPLITSSRVFARAAWPIPRFRRVNSLIPGMSTLVEYDQDATRMLLNTVRQQWVPTSDVADLPEEGLDGSGAVEIKLARLLQD